jgi:hypothetical protein
VTINWFLASTPMLVTHVECMPISIRRIGSSGTPDEWILPVKIKINNIEMDKRVFFISTEIYKIKTSKSIKYWLTFLFSLKN